MDTFFLFPPTSWGESLSKFGRVLLWKDSKDYAEDDDEGNEEQYRRERTREKEYDDEGKRTRYDKKIIPRRTYKIEDMPDYLKFNPWILTGYRAPKLTTKQSLQSLTYVHNESVNILTHAIPIVLVVYYFRSLFGSLPACWFTWFHAVSCLTPWVGSFVYHVLMNHRSGGRFYTQLLRLDMSGIWFTQTFGALTTISVSFAAFSDPTRHCILGFYLLLSLYALYKGLTASNTFQRMSSFVALVTIRVIAFAIRSQTHTDYPLVGYHLVHVINQEALPILGAILSAGRIPERFWPGKFDILFNSHNIMHCLVVAGGIHMHLAFRKEIELARIFHHF